MSNLNSKKAIKERLNPKIRHGRHCTFLIHAHLVFVTKYRRVCFTPRVLDHLKEVFDSVCNDFEAELVEFQGEGDHVHLLVNYPPKVALSRFVGSLKGVSSRYIRESNYPEIKKKTMGKSSLVSQLLCRKLRWSTFGNNQAIHRATGKASLISRRRAFAYISALKYEVLRKSSIKPS